MFLYSKCLDCSYFSYCMKRGFWQLYSNPSRGTNFNYCIAGHLLCLYSKWSKRMELNGAGAELGQ